MGIRSGGSFTFTVSNVKGLLELQAICSQIQLKKGQQSERIKVDVDCSLIGHRTEIKSAKEVVDFLVVLAKNGLVVTPICNGEDRHSSKRATVQHCYKTRKS